MNFIVFLIIGGIAGALAGGVMSGPGYGVVMDVVVGVIGAFIGGWLLSTILGVSTSGSLIISFIAAFVGAVVLLWVIRLVTGNRARACAKFRGVKGAPSAPAFFVGQHSPDAPARHACRNRHPRVARGRRLQRRGGCLGLSGPGWGQAGAGRRPGRH